MLGAATAGEVTDSGIGLFFFSRYISSSLDDACVGQLEAAKKIIHLLDMNHLGKKAITLGFNDSDSENIEYKERFEKSKEYLISVAELVSLTGKAGTFFSELHNSIAVIEKTRELEQLCAIISTSIEYKISRLYKDYEILTRRQFRSLCGIGDMLSIKVFFYSFRTALKRQHA